MVREVLSRETSRKSFKDLLNPYLNPHGIKEMAASQGFRNEAFGVDLPLLESADFLTFVAGGQLSILHLAEFAHTRLLPLMEARLVDLRARYTGATANENLFSGKYPLTSKDSPPILQSLESNALSNQVNLPSEFSDIILAEIMNWSIGLVASAVKID